MAANDAMAVLIAAASRDEQAVAAALRVRPRPRLQRLPARRRRAVQEVPDLRPALRRAAGGGARHARARGAHLRAAQVGSLAPPGPKSRKG